MFHHLGLLDNPDSQDHQDSRTPDLMAERTNEASITIGKPGYAWLASI